MACKATVSLLEPRCEPVSFVMVTFPRSKLKRQARLKLKAGEVSDKIEVKKAGEVSDPFSEVKHSRVRGGGIQGLYFSVSLSSVMNT